MSVARDDEAGERTVPSRFPRVFEGAGHFRAGFARAENDGFALRLRGQNGREFFIRLRGVERGLEQSLQDFLV
jgi:hypothetical protein